MNKENKIRATEVDRERWRFVLYQTSEKELYGNFSYQPTSFVDTSMIIKLNQEEKQTIKDNRNCLIGLSEKIRNQYGQFEGRKLNRNLFEFRNRPNYSFITIDLSLPKTIEELHSTFKKELIFPESYGMNWDAFWNAITGLTKMPTNLILYNFRSISEKFKEHAGILRRAIIDFNKINYQEQIHLDYLDELPPLKNVNNPSCLMMRRPFQFGLRGDKPLWDDLEKELQILKFPETEDELTTQIHSSIEKLTQNRILDKEKIFVDKYNEGGMSGGYVSSQFWLRKGIPIIINRFKEMKKAGNK